MAVRRMTGAAIALVVFGAVVLAGAEALRRMNAPDSNIATTRVRRGRFEPKIYAVGDLRPARSAMLVAPSIGGGLQIVSVLKTGSRVRAGDVVVQFDPSEQEYNLAQNRSEVEQAEQEILKMKADAAVQEAEERVELLRARFDVRRAELEIGRNDLLAAIQAKKNLLNLEEAKRRLDQLEQDLESHRVSRQADFAVQQEKVNKAKIAMMIARQNIDHMTVKSPIDGIVALKENVDASGGILFTGMVLPEYREGDQVWPGRMIAEVLDVAQMEIRSKIKEIDAGNISPNQSVEVSLDTLPGRRFRGKVKAVAGFASQGVIFDNSPRTFDAVFQLAPDGFPARSGASAQVTVFGDRVQGALLLPRQALFQKEGKPVVYKRSADGFAPTEVKVLRAGEAQIEIAGLAEGTEVAVVDPEMQTKKTRNSATQTPGPAVRGGQ